MPRYKVTDPEGVMLGGKRVPHGELLPATSATTSQIKAWLRFKQIAEVKEEKPKEDPEDQVPPPRPAAKKAAKKAANGTADEDPEDPSEPPSTGNDSPPTL